VVGTDNVAGIKGERDGAIQWQSGVLMHPMFN
jgi:hypothetical protein